MTAQLYNDLIKIEVNSSDHGVRVFVVVSRSFQEALSEIETFVQPWIDDLDLTIKMQREDSEMFVVVPDKALGETG